MLSLLVLFTFWSEHFSVLISNTIQIRRPHTIFVLNSPSITMTSQASSSMECSPEPIYIPPFKGYKFLPTDELLVSHYLFNKVTGAPLLNVVLDFDVFGAQDPWEIWSTFQELRRRRRQEVVVGFDDDDEGDLYFFTKQKRTTPTAKNCIRKIGTGSWKGQDHGAEIYDSGNVLIGRKKRFHYDNKGIKEHHGSWIMFEYSLAGSLAHDRRIMNGFHDCVLCQIRKRIGSKDKMKNFKIIADGDDVEFDGSHDQQQEVIVQEQQTVVDGDQNLGSVSIPPFLLDSSSLPSSKLTSFDKFDDLDSLLTDFGDQLK